MLCPNCKTENATGTLFCTHCGRSLGRFSADVPQMVWQAQDGTTQSFVISGAVTIGRSAGSDIVIPDSAMSRQHARVEVEAGGCRISDLGSLNGVSVNGERISEPYPLVGGDLIRIGHTTFTFEPAAPPAEVRPTIPMAAIEDPGASPGENPSLPTVAMASDSEEVPDAGAEEVPDASDDRTILGPGGTESPFAAVPEAPIAGYLVSDVLRVPIRAELSVGRFEGSDLRIENDRSMSRNHARIEVLSDGVQLEDLNSANGTFLDGARLTGKAMLTDGAEIRFGASVFRFEANTPTQPPAGAVEPGTEAIAAVRDSDMDSGATIISATDSGATMIAEDIQEHTLQGNEADLYLREAQLAEFQAMRSGDAELAPPKAEAKDQHRLVVNFGPEAGAEFPLTDDVTVIGRASADADYNIQLNDRAVSRPHAKIVRDGASFVIHDLESANGTWLNYTEEISAPRKLVDGDLLKLGKTTLIYRVPAAIRPPEKETILDPLVGQILTFFTLKGGVGTTSLAVNLATLLRTLTNQTVLLIDLSTERGAVSVHLNLIPKLTLADLPEDPSLIDADVLESLIFHHPSGLDILAAPPSPQTAELVTAAAVSAVLPLVRSQYKWVVIDTSATFSELNLGVIDHSDLLLLVAAPDLTSLKVTRSMLDVFSALLTPPEKRVLILNQTPPKAHLKQEDFEQALGERIGLMLPYADDAVLDSIDHGVPLATAEPSHPFISALESFAMQLADVKTKAQVQAKRGGLGQWVQGVIGSMRR